MKQRIMILDLDAH